MLATKFGGHVLGTEPSILASEFVVLDLEEMCEIFLSLVLGVTGPFYSSYSILSFYFSFAADCLAPSTHASLVASRSPLSMTAFYYTRLFFLWFLDRAVVWTISRLFELET